MASSVTKKKEEEQNLKTLRELTAIEYNKKCLECSQRGITYADMTTNGFVCVQCSGFLRGLNPPHRVKSISMTTFSQAEIEALKNGGNELARKVWLGKWNSKRDREPDKSDENAFKNFLISKYERRTWYVDPKEAVKKEEKTTPKPEPKLLPPPTSKTTPTTERPRGGAQQPPAPTPTTTVAPTPAPATPVDKKVDLLGDLQGDPFASRPPVGGVSVLPAGGFKQDDFGAFTGATQVPTPVSTTLTAPTPNTTSSAGDKYAALASLDDTFRELKVKEEPPRQPSPGPPTSQPFSGAPTNPFGGPTQSISNPFGGQQASLQGQQSGAGFGAQPQGQGFGATGPGFPAQPQQFGGQQAFLGGQGFGAQPQQFGAFGHQAVAPGQPNPYMQQQQWAQQRPQGQIPPGVSFGAVPQGQWSGQPRAQLGAQQHPGFGAQQQQAQFGNPQQAQFGNPQQLGGFGVPQHGGFGQQAQFGAPRPQSGFSQQSGFGTQLSQAGFGAPKQSAFVAQQPNQFGGLQQQQGGFGALKQSGFSGQQQQAGFGNTPSTGFGSFPQQQSGGFGAQKTQPPNQFQWNSTPASTPSTQMRTGNTVSSSSGGMGWSSNVAVNTMAGSQSSTGWSSELSKPAPHSTWGLQLTQPQQAAPTGGASWSSELVSGQSQQQGGGGGWAGGQMNWGQQPSVGGGTGQGSANPFAAPSQTTPTNPFL